MHTNQKHCPVLKTLQAAQQGKGRKLQPSQKDKRP